jgi:O-glycosyl hydrolase
MQIDAVMFSAACARLRSPPKVVLSSWSPPPCLKASGRMRGGTPDSKLRCCPVSGKPVVDELACWLVHSVNAYRALGVSVDYCSIQNEPNHDPSGHEGCTYKAPREYQDAVEATRDAFRRLSSPPSLVGPEHTSINGWLSSGKHLNALDVIGNHIYYGNESEESVTTAITETGKWSRKTGRVVWMTETAKLAEPERDDPIKLATRIHNCFVLGNMSAFLIWDLFWGAGTGEGMLLLVDSPFTGNRNDWRNDRGFTVLPSFWYFAHFCRFVRPGSLRVHIESSSKDVLASAFVQSRVRFCIILINTSRNALRHVALLTDSAVDGGISQVFQSTLDTPMANIGALQTSAIDCLPPQSITTVVIGPE